MTRKEKINELLRINQALSEKAAKTNVMQLRDVLQKKDVVVNNLFTLFAEALFENENESEGE